MMDHQAQILHALLAADHRYVSGNELARQFKISRPAVYNNILKLERCGHQIDTKKGLGYCYEQSGCLNSQVINHYRTTTYPVDVQTFDTLTST
ncbi:HTH domain-containing protein [Levilactobacillus parabrevis]|jgi:BirA family biotin operon repressor/biotin-[acetyl-CoA-carboxylase] ligase|nr:HTH domain-containing protein [Levilactobacillus parabrevis]